MKHIFILLSLIVILKINAQTIKGSVFDENEKPLYGANVYLDGSSIATSTDQNGNFTLLLNSKINLPLVISFTGFQTQYFKNYNTDKSLRIILKAELNDLKEVVIRKPIFSRKQMMRVFKKQFLGTTEAANKTVIENENEISFSYDQKSKQLNAFSNVPLEIKNSYLGYKINYQLVNFEITFTYLSIESHDVMKSFYSGLSRFEELNADAKIIKRRNKNYEGSSLHFFRSLSKNDLVKNKFLLFDGKFAIDSKLCFEVNDTLDLKKVTVIKNPKGLKPKNFVAEYSILYNKKEQSKIIFYTDTFYIDTFGNFSDIESILFSGDLSNKRVWNMLPLNFGL